MEWSYLEKRKELERTEAFVLQGQGFRVLIMPWLVVSGPPYGQNGPYVMDHLVSTRGLAREKSHHAETKITFSRRGLIWKKESPDRAGRRELFLFLRPPVFPLHIASIFWLCLGGPSGDLGRGNPSPAPWGSSRTSKPVSVLLPARARTHACLGRKLPQPHIFFSRKIQPGFSVEIPDVC